MKEPNVKLEYILTFFSQYYSQYLIKDDKKYLSTDVMSSKPKTTKEVTNNDISNRVNYSKSYTVEKLSSYPFNSSNSNEDISSIAYYNEIIFENRPNEKSFNFNNDQIDKKLKKASKYEFIKFIKIINREAKISKLNDSFIETADFFLNVHNTFYISGGINAPLMYYDLFFKHNPDLKINNPKNISYKIYEGINNNQIIGLFQNKIKSYKIKSDNIKIIESNLRINEIIRCYSCVKMGKDKYIMFNTDGIIVIEDLFNPILSYKTSKLLDNIGKGGIKLGPIEDKNDTSYAFFSNSITNEGEDKLYFSSIYSKKIDKEIAGYSIILSSNALSLMKIYKNKNNNKDDVFELLLCSCKKYKKKQKNGILLVDLENEIKNKYFYNTGKFEVYCCCQLLKIHNKNPYIKDSKDNDYYLYVDKRYTKYFLVGGYDTGKYQGLIKLYKIIINKKNDSKFKIKFIQNIVINKINNNYNGKDCGKMKFYGPISSIIQSEITGNIVATCWDGNIYLFTPPNIEELDEIENSKNINIYI